MNQGARARMLGHMSAWGRCWCVMCCDSWRQRDRVRRAIKRRERQGWKKEAKD
jgi:hypothetical protein